jgi:hypothetical protein
MTQETLQAENAELKRKLAEAAENACPCSGGGHTLTKCPYFRAEAAERERDEAEARCKEEKGRRQVAEADLRKTEEHRLAAVAQSVRYERKCAELSEALRALDSAMLLHTCDQAVRKINNEPNWYDLHKQANAAIASQPAPEAKPEMSAEVPPNTWYCGCGHYNGFNLATCAACSRPPGGFPEEQVERWRKPTPEAP